MADFDPYYQWLAIPPRDQPPNHYRLLGVEPFESNADVLATAADKQMAHVRSFQSGKHSALSQRLLNEIAAAKVCLLNPAKKEVYDRQLRPQSVAPPAPPVPPSPPVPQPAVDMDYLKAPVILSRAVPVTPEQSPNKKPIWLGTGLIAAAALILVAVFILLSFHRGNELASTDEPLPTPSAPLDKQPRDKQPSPAPRDGPRDNLPQDAAPSPSPDSEKPGDSSLGKTVERPAGPASPPLEGGLRDTAKEPEEPSAKGVVAAEKAKSSDPAQRPKEKPGAADTAMGPKEKSPGSDASVAPDQRLPVPDEAAGKLALAIIRETYKDDYRSADKVALAQKLLLKADGSRSDPVARFELLQEAKKVAVETGQPELALEAADALADEYQVASAEMKAQIVEQGVKLVRYAQQRQAVAEFALQVLEEAVAEDNFDVAKRMGRQAMQMARLSADKELVQEVTAKNNEVEAAAKAYTSVLEAMAALRHNPRNPDASLIVGRHLCFTKGDWANGLPMLALGSDVALKALAAADLQGAATSEEQVKLGDAWWKVAKQRAIYWYARAESGADSQLLKDRLEKRIKEGTQTTRWIRIFRSADPSHWNLDADRAGAAKVPENIKYLKMQIARKMVVIIEMTKDRLGQDNALPPGSSKKYGWAGANQSSADARHLGIFVTSAVLKPGDGRDDAGKVSITGAGQTGWGFGHRLGGGQACAWAGQSLLRTIFEIDVTSDYLTAKEEPYLLK